MNYNLRQNKAITLIALVITIIVLLILVGVVIASLTGENGLLNRATTAKEKTEEGRVLDEVGLAWSDIQIDGLKEGWDNVSKATNLATSLKKGATATASGDNIIVNYDGYTATINTITGEISINKNFEETLSAGDEVIYTYGEGNEIPCIVIETGDTIKIISKEVVGEKISLAGGTYYTNVTTDNNYANAIINLNTAAASYLNTDIATTSYSLGSGVSYSELNNLKTSLESINSWNVGSDYWIAIKSSAEEPGLITGYYVSWCDSTGSDRRVKLMEYDDRIMATYYYSDSHYLRPIFELKQDVKLSYENGDNNPPKIIPNN